MKKFNLIINNPNQSNVYFFLFRERPPTEMTFVFLCSLGVSISFCLFKSMFRGKVTKLLSLKKNEGSSKEVAI